MFIYLNISVNKIPTLKVIIVPNIQLCNFNVLLSSIVFLSILLSRSLISDFNSVLTVLILLSRSLISDFNSVLTVLILLSRSLISDFNSVLTLSILLFKLFSTVLILLSRS
ncbi:hypothetical protein F9Y90_05410 (plasmid) [Borrelia miyamotoi]|uniref:Uncharacterized protein n=1 Tax=Borrelia miyamotoi TaxID=47466 RepID=A0A5P8AVF1_9SPIR|nr:hypothetical protein F9Y90_05410 [Borrelia miyamotoi]